MPQSWAKELQEKLKSSKNYLKTDYKLHIAAESRCADHCRLHALSDTGKEFQGKCLHEHDVACDRCETLESTLAEIEVAVSSDKTQLRYNFSFRIIKGNQHYLLKILSFSFINASKQTPNHCIIMYY